MFQKLLKNVAEKDLLETAIKIKRAEFEETIADDKQLLDDLREEEIQLRKEVYETLKENKEKSIVVDDKIISRQVKKTLKIIDSHLLLSSIQYNKKEIEDNIDIDIETFVKEYFKPSVEITNKKEVLSIIDMVYKIEGKILEGAEEAKTEFLTIRDNN